jgi:hypothetical protein
MCSVVTVSGAGFEGTVRRGAAHHYFSLQDAFSIDEFFEETLDLLVYAEEGEALNCFVSLRELYAEGW